MSESLVEHVRDFCRIAIAKDATWVWLLNPRTGHTSMRKVLDPHCVMQWRSSSQSLRQAVEPHLVEVFKFTFVRNPWDRVVFGRLWSKRGGSRRTTDFRTYVLEDLKDDQDFLHFKPQVHTFMCDGRFIPNMFIGRFEQLTQSWLVVADRLGVQKRLPHVNKANHKSYADYYDRASRLVVADLYAEEIDSLGYAFGA